MELEAVDAREEVLELDAVLAEVATEAVEVRQVEAGRGRHRGEVSRVALGEVAVEAGLGHNAAAVLGRELAVWYTACENDHL